MERVLVNTERNQVTSPLHPQRLLFDSKVSVLGQPYPWPSCTPNASSYKGLQVGVCTYPVL